MSKPITTGPTENLQAEHDALTACLAVLPTDSPTWGDMQARAMTVLDELLRRKGALWRLDWARDEA